MKKKFIFEISFLFIFVILLVVMTAVSNAWEGFAYGFCCMGIINMILQEELNETKLKQQYTVHEPFPDINGVDES